MSVALRGNLKDFGIAEVFQLIGQQGKTGVLEATGGGDARVQLRFDGGKVVSASPVGVYEHAALGEMLVRCGLLTREKLDALETQRAKSGEALPKLLFDAGAVSVPEIEEIEELLTRETIFELLRWQSGSFHFSAQAVAHDRPAHTLLGAEQILMDGLRMVDEFRTFRSQVPGDDAVFQRAASFDRYREGAVEVSSRQLAASERVYLLVDGRLSVRRVIDLSRLGSFEATRILAELARAGVIAPLAAEQLERTRRRRRMVAPEVSGLERALAQGLPFALAGVLLVAALFTGRPPARDAALAWRAPLEEARMGFAVRRVRNALDAHRYAVGEPPASLRELADKGFLPPDALTPADGGSYYYARTGKDAVVLAPER